MLARNYVDKSSINKEKKEEKVREGRADHLFYTQKSLEASLATNMDSKLSRVSIVELLSDDNYIDWSATIESFLTADETWEIIQGVVTPVVPADLNERGQNMRKA
jgi:hypothetical protein